jgi:His-Xaa-Ser system protein HxsD
VPVEIDVDLSVYPLEPTMGAAYVFLDRCYVFLDKLPDGKVRVALTGKPGCTEDALAVVAGEFRNELLSQALRHQVGLRHEKLRELLLARALFGAAPQLEHGDDDDEDAADDSEEAMWKALEELPDGDEAFLDDPLGIAVSWEERFGHKAGSPAVPVAPAAVAPAGAPAEDASPPTDAGPVEGKGSDVPR